MPADRPYHHFDYDLYPSGGMFDVEPLSGHSYRHALDVYRKHM
jgi:hypothetical protein